MKDRAVKIYPWFHYYYGSRFRAIQYAQYLCAYREIRKELCNIEKRLAAAGYSEDELPANVINNISFARANMKMNIYDQAVLEGVATSFPQTEEIKENGKVSGMTATDVQKILNLKHA